MLGVCVLFIHLYIVRRRRKGRRLQIQSWSSKFPSQFCSFISLICSRHVFKQHRNIPPSPQKGLHPHPSFYQSASNSRRFTTKPSDQSHQSRGITMLSYSRVFLVIFNLVILLSLLVQLHVAKSMKHESQKKPCMIESARAITFNAIFLLITSIVGIIGTCGKVKSLQAIYLWIMLILTISSFGYMVFISILLPRVSAERIWKRSQDGHWLNEYQPGLQKALISGKDWFTIRNCYVEFRVCDVWRNQSTIKGRNYAELGCCHPPARCKLVQKNGTSWETPKSGIDPNDKECILWTMSNNAGHCYDCDSCKAGYLSKYQEDWQQGTFLHIFRFVFLTVVTVLTLYAYNDDHNTRLERYT